jgi:hypothetical protein
MDISVDLILDPTKIYEVWTPIDMPEASQTLISFLVLVSSNQKKATESIEI